MLLGLRVYADYPIHRLCSIGRVQRRQHKVTRLRRFEGDLRGLHVAHLADQNNLRRLAQRGP